MYAGPSGHDAGETRQTTETMNVDIAIAQIDAKLGDLKANRESHLASIDRAIKQGARLILFPELSLTGYTLRDLAWEVALNPSDPFFRLFLQRSKSITIVLGFVESAPDHGIYNAALVMEDGEVKDCTRKIYPPTYGMFEEGRYFSRGQRVAAFDSKHGRFGVLICEDLWHLSLPYLLSLDGAEAILTLTASPTRMADNTKELQTAAVNHEHLKAYARLLSSYILFCNRVGFEDGVNFWGGSAVAGPGGDLIARSPYFEEDLLFTHLDSHAVQRSRRFSRHFLDENIDLVQRTLQRISAKRS